MRSRLPLTCLAGTFSLLFCVPASADVGVALSGDGQSVRWTLPGSSDLRCRADPPIADRTVCEDVYPGIRLTLDRGGEGVTYRFDVAPGADPSVIRMRYEGVEEVRVEEGGRALRLRQGKNVLRERGLRCFQESDDVPCGYIVNEQRDMGWGTALALGSYNAREPLVIDPEISWSSCLGGSERDNAYGVAVDSAGNVYVAGFTDSTDFPAMGGFDTTYNGGDYDGFVAKVSAAGSSLVWSSYIGGVRDDWCSGIAVDSDDNVYVTGGTGSTDFPTTGGFDTILGGERDGFVAKVNASGSGLAWSSYLGGSQIDDSLAIAVDPIGNVCVAGTTESADFPTMGGFDTARGGFRDAFVTKVNAAGSSLAWSSYLGGFAEDVGIGVAVDSDGNVYITGSTRSTDFPTMGGFDTMLGGGWDAFVTKVNAEGSSLAWSSYLGGSGNENTLWVGDIAVGSAGNVYVTGRTASLDFPTTGGFDTTLGGASDAFVTKVNAAGSSLAWSSYLGGSGDDNSWWGAAIAVDSAGNVYVAGHTRSTDFPTMGGFDTTYGEGGTTTWGEGFVTKVNAGGSSLAWSSYLGGLDGDAVRDIVVDANGTVYVAGFTESTDFPTVGGLGGSCGRGVDAFVTRVGSTCGNGVCDPGESPCGFCPEDCPEDVCGDGCCTGSETSCSCAPDCGDICGDGCCTVGETDCPESCPDDCSPACGNGCCTGAETECSCPTDCIGIDSCGDGCCSFGETACTCLADCVEACGDGCCTGSEDSGNCAVDCPPSCGDGPCTADEDTCNCPEDCGSICGDGCCNGAEDACAPGCETDCPAACGDGCCTGGESKCDCPDDCTADLCGDGCCTGGETKCDCADDCTVDLCGDGCCTGGESKCDCPGDCTVDICGDGCCTGPETCSSCSADCECPPDAGVDAPADGVADAGVDASTDAMVDAAGEPLDAGNYDESGDDAGSDSPAGLNRQPAPRVGCDCRLGTGEARGLWWVVLLLAACRRRRRI